MAEPPLGVLRHRTHIGSMCEKIGGTSGNQTFGGSACCLQENFAELYCDTEVVLDMAYVWGKTKLTSLIPNCCLRAPRALGARQSARNFMVGK